MIDRGERLRTTLFIWIVLAVVGFFAWKRYQAKRPRPDPGEARRAALPAAPPAKGE